MEKLIIDPEFRDKIPPLTDDEFKQLRENILEDGEVYEPIITWNNTIIDGYNRWKIICENWELLKDKYRTKPMEFADKWAASEWMYKKQLGRRNLSDEQRKYAIGKMYEARKNTSAFKGNQHTAGGAQSEHKQSADGNRTAAKIAEEVGVARETVKRSEKFAKGVDALREASPEAADKVLRGGSGVSQSAVAELASKPTDEIKQTAQEIVTGTFEKKPSSNPKGFTKEQREQKAKIAAVVADMYDPTTAKEFTVDDLVNDIRINAEAYVNLLRNTLADRNALLTAENRPIVAEAITKYVMNEIEKVRDLVK